MHVCACVCMCVCVCMSDIIFSSYFQNKRALECKRLRVEELKRGES